MLYTTTSRNTFKTAASFPNAFNPKAFPPFSPTEAHERKQCKPEAWSGPDAGRKLGTGVVQLSRLWSSQEQDNGVEDMSNTRVALSKQQHQQQFGGYSFNLLLLKTIQNLTKLSEY